MKKMKRFLPQLKEYIKGGAWYIPDWFAFLSLLSFLGMFGSFLFRPNPIIVFILSFLSISPFLWIGFLVGMFFFLNRTKKNS
jgi:hypothetical protein